ncbi:MAG: cytochrome c oxidase subunit II [Candidatus Omnitrophica bacterium CG11_big_fil_rev_8_21_14_0_20_45_26]|uniref:cytochrome-c oxidase n=1 Tax=Candidatus Abzuiibacterium crystallinum TaxID=1974748 RepID=A0A2H0LL18_9BACT|nr:MAG: cytochrome c oxidase subunit II [Candidatus Omnitrophica bacterium CG11_big_fil_rev_8_21_14_0_20_45_26]PIW63866.1 MAG: cytochrome c oxidase subunit II [Candidatus Omnitrophica bacterium CG12_big_fil_rev_8_21_14_0_65_45_16]
MLFPQNISKSGEWVDRLFYLGLILTSIAFVLVIATLIYFLIRYRCQANQKAYYTHGDSKKAIGLTLALAIIVFFAIDINLAVHDHFAWEEIWGRATNAKNPLQIEVMPEQFAWNIRYAGNDGIFGTADDVATINEMHIPVNRPINVALKSKDVIHSFFIPNFRIKQDAVPGLVTYLSFQAVQTGQFDIACAEHCGLGHYRMRGQLTVEDEAAWQKWLAEKSDENTGTENWGWQWEAASRESN